MTPPSSRLSWFNRLPSFVWIILFILGIAALIGGIILLFYGLSSIEGFASVLMIVIAWGVIRFGSDDNAESTPSSAGQKMVVAGAITFFALMGMAIDQPGNYLYNRPIEWFFCPSGTELHRGVDVTHPLPGRTDVTQDFTCVDPRENVVIDTPSMGGVIATRFVEYVLVAYILIALNRLYRRFWRFRRVRSNPAG